MSKEGGITDFPQQILQYLHENHSELIDNGYSIEELKSAQQKMWTVRFTLPQQNMGNPLQSNSDKKWFDLVVRTGGSRIIVRQWRGSSRWWNLNNNQMESSPKRLARAEVAAYRLARKALSHLGLPQVLHFHDDCGQTQSLTSDSQYPWAIFSYVGAHSIHFCSKDRFEYSTQWIDQMVKVRHEFGFDEPHPRWGRVPLDRAEEFALHVLRTVTIPLHQYIADHPQNDISWSDLHLRSGSLTHTTYADMVTTYQEAHTVMVDQVRRSSAQNETLMSLLKTLDQCILELSDIAFEINPLPGVLVHMDCQPQNFIFGKYGDKTFICSVLDWEEAAFADPRFELLLLCRKVCANRKQADCIWKTYAKECQPLIGDIEPWLRLETIHSITSLTLQSLNLLGGGRNPWESHREILEKIEREFCRLVPLGKGFCFDPTALLRLSSSV